MAFRSTNISLPFEGQLPKAGADLARGLVLPGGACPYEGESDLNLSIKPSKPELLPVVNTLSSLEVAEFIKSLSGEDLQRLRSFGVNLKNHILSGDPDELVLIEEMTNRLYLIQSKSILTINFLGPDTWRGVIKNQDALTKEKYENLPENERTILRSNLFTVARNLATLPEEALTVIETLRKHSAGNSGAIDSISSLQDYIVKRAVERNHDAWKFRKFLDGSPHDEKNTRVLDLPAKSRLFAGLMGIGTFQILREAGLEACQQLIKLGALIQIAGEIDITRLRQQIKNDRMLLSIPFLSAKSISLSPDFMAHFRDSHHSLWLTIRSLTWLLPRELHQPERREHQPIENLDQTITNQSCIHILSLAMSLADDSMQIAKSPALRDLLNTAAKGNPYDLNLSLFNEHGETI